MRPSSSKVAVRPYTLPPTPPLSPVTSEGSYAESLDEHCPPPPCPTAAAVQPARSSSSSSSQPALLTVPPPGALVFDQRVHRYPPKPFTRRERARLWYGGLLFETLESVRLVSRVCPVSTRADSSLCHSGRACSSVRSDPPLHPLADLCVLTSPRLSSSVRPMLPHSLTALNDEPRHRHRHCARPLPCRFHHRPPAAAPRTC